MSYHIKLDSYKHHNSSSCWLAISRMADNDMCPVLAFQHYWNIRPKCHGVFFIWSDGRPLVRSQFVKCLTDLLRYVGLDHIGYNTHSLRIGRTTDLALASVPQKNICLIGRWSSDAYQKYIRPSLLVLSQWSYVDLYVLAFRAPSTPIQFWENIK